MKIFFSVGEPSADEHAAHLIEELHQRQPHCEFVGFGGEAMANAGCQIIFRLTDLAVMGVLRVLPMLLKFYRVYRQAKRYFETDRPDAVVLIDFPGFNWWVAKAAKREGIPVFYYLPPQLWAWGPWRIKRVRKYVDYVISGLSFEKRWYEERGVQVEFVGHPFFDKVKKQSLDRIFIDQHRGDQPVVGILPGSRSMEIAKSWDVMLKIMHALHSKHPQVRFLVANYKESHKHRCEKELQKLGWQLPIEFHIGKTSEIIELTDCCAMVSGSVSLEMLARRTPACVVYRFKWWGYLGFRLFCSLKSITLPNLMSGKTILPEWLIVHRSDHVAVEISEMLASWIFDEKSQHKILSQIDDLCAEEVKLGSAGNTASFILEKLEAKVEEISKAA